MYWRGVDAAAPPLHGGFHLFRPDTWAVILMPLHSVPAEACQSDSLSLPFCFLFCFSVASWDRQVWKCCQPLLSDQQWQSKHGWIVWAPPPPVSFTPHGMFWLRSRPPPPLTPTADDMTEPEVHRQGQTINTAVKWADGHCHVPFKKTIRIVDPQYEISSSCSTSAFLRGLFSLSPDNITQRVFNHIYILNNLIGSLLIVNKRPESKNI